MSAVNQNRARWCSVLKLQILGLIAADNYLSTRRKPEMTAEPEKLNHFNRTFIMLKCFFYPAGKTRISQKTTACRFSKLGDIVFPGQFNLALSAPAPNIQQSLSIDESGLFRNSRFKKLC